MPNGRAWKEKLRLTHLKSPAKSSSSLTQDLQALGSGLMFSCLAQAREKRWSEDDFGDVVMTN